MERTARALAGYGRHGDNNLLHVSDQELRGIELLSGKKFTRNPDTGLPEAFNWSSLIPVAAGIAGTAVAGPMGGALAAGATSAAKAKIEGKSTEQALTQGLISGVTSYAGGQIFAGAPTAASEAAGEGFGQVAAEGANVAAPSVASMSPEAAMASLPSTPTEFTTGVSGLGTGTPAVPAGPIGSAQIYGGAGSVGPTAPSFTQGISNTATNLANNPSAALAKVGENIQEKPFSALMAAGGTYSTAMDMMGPPKMPGEIPYDPSKYPEQFPVNPRTWNAPGAGYQPGYSPEYRYFAKGGLANLRKEDGVTANVMNEAKAALLGEHPRPSEALGRFRNMFGEDALDVLRDKVTGGRVRGAGGGMDDLVPGTIEGRQQVRLADGEFVVPADVVSGLGDGSTDQGVRRLHEMMSKVRQQRTGKQAQPKAIGGKISL
jgi:hypothetical protein